MIISWGSDTMEGPLMYACPFLISSPADNGIDKIIITYHNLRNDKKISLQVDI